MYSTIEFCKEYFIKSLPETAFLFMFLQLFVTNKKHECSIVVSFIISLNLFIFMIISILDTVDLLELILVNMALMLSMFLYDKSISIKRLVIGIILMNFVLVILQAISVSFVYFIFNISIQDIDEIIFYNMVTRIVTLPFQLYILFKLNFYKNRRILNESSRKN